MSDNSNERVLRELAEIKTLISWVGVGVFVLIITSDHHTPSWLQGLDWVLIIGGLVAVAVGCGVVALVGWCLWMLVERLVLHPPPCVARCRLQAPGRCLRNCDVLHGSRLAAWYASRCHQRAGVGKPRHQSRALSGDYADFPNAG
ncbi:hypothetical protein [Rhizobium leguminosarum]|uniref:hypothetical protein n=1 Tax=Rhizobium leguminosarum TaxID=384 RepID=UPI0012FA256A|nr:hypothetical protein [Rhizobium leguminosarum]